MRTLDLPDLGRRGFQPPDSTLGFQIVLYKTCISQRFAAKMQQSLCMFLRHGDNHLRSFNFVYDTGAAKCFTNRIFKYSNIFEMSVSSSLDFDVVCGCDEPVRGLLMQSTFRTMMFSPPFWADGSKCFLDWFVQVGHKTHTHTHISPLQFLHAGTIWYSDYHTLTRNIHCYIARVNSLTWREEQSRDLKKKCV